MNKLLSLIVALLWLMAAAQILFEVSYLPEAMTVLVLFFLSSGLPRMPRHAMILCGTLVIVILLLAQIYDQWAAIPAGIAKATIFPAFLATIVAARRSRSAPGIRAPASCSGPCRRTNEIAGSSSASDRRGADRVRRAGADPRAGCAAR